MKRIAALSFVLSFCWLSAFSQDIIVKNNGDEIQAKIKEVNLQEIKYQLFTYKDGPIITIAKTDVFMIKYENGTKEVITEKTPATQQNDKQETITVTYRNIYSNTTKQDREIKHLLKFDPLLIFLGEIPVMYERRIKDQFSVEGGLGYTFQDYFRTSIDEADDEISTANSNTISRTYKPGYSLRVGANIYPSKYTKALDEYYFGVGIINKRYNADAETATKTNADHRTYTDFMLKGGFIYYATDMVIFDVYGGIGVRNESSKWSDSKGVQISTNESRLRIMAGVRIGFGF